MKEQQDRTREHIQKTSEHPDNSRFRNPTKASVESSVVPPASISQIWSQWSEMVVMCSVLYLYFQPCLSLLQCNLVYIKIGADFIPKLSICEAIFKVKKKSEILNME